MSPTQEQMFYAAGRKIADGNDLMMEMIRNQEITNAELAELVKRRPEVYGRFKGFIGKIEELK